MGPNDFKFKPLPEGSIRLVQLKTGPLLRISLKLGIFALAAAPRFTALSYTWGGEERSQLINLQGKPYRITPNLESFLWEAKHRIETSSVAEERGEKEWNGGWLWIDSICIDQSNTEEKNGQVAIMKDIYESAQTIIPWLGELDDNARLAMEYIFNFDHFRESRSPIQQSPISDAEWRLHRDKSLHATQKLISKSYWRRIWILQEATTPKESCHSLVWCGSYTDGFDSFTRTAEFLTRLSMVDGLPGKLHNVSTDALRGLISIRNMRQNHTTCVFGDIYCLLSYVHIFNSTDPKDKVFGLLSLASEQSIKSLAPNYHLQT
jgi:Heterokaryon incompatibility protein (HET)